MTKDEIEAFYRHVEAETERLMPGLPGLLKTCLEVEDMTRTIAEIERVKAPPLIIVTTPDTKPVRFVR